MRVSEAGLRVYRGELILAKLDFLLRGWNWICAAIIQEWEDKDSPKPSGYRETPETWQIWDWAKVLRSCARDDGDLTFDCESVKLTRAEEKSYAALFKNPCTGKNGYRTIEYHDRFRKNMAMALMHILRPSRTTYMMAWQVVFV